MLSQRAAACSESSYFLKPCMNAGLGEHFGWETIEGLGKKRLRPLRRSSALTKAEFSEFVGYIQRRAAELGVYIPDPSDEVRTAQEAT